MKLKIGQVWKDNDPRLKGKRRIEIAGFDGSGFVKARNILTGHVTRIARKRFGLTGAKGYSFAAKSRAGRKPGPQLHLVSVTMKMKKAMNRRMLKKAKRYARSESFPEGNLSAWLRQAGVHYTPKKGEKIKMDAA